jgi:hypothetical protein
MGLTVNRVADEGMASILACGCLQYKDQEVEGRKLVGHALSSAW